MLTAHDIHELNTAAAILAGGLTEEQTGSIDGLPPEVAQALSEARSQMETLPEVIENLNLSFERFATVSSALWRMLELAEVAAASETSDERRSLLNDEFISLAAVVAADAGRHYYSGPRLNLLNQGEAQSALKIVGYMAPVMNNTARELTEQKNLIYEAISETINFLGVIAHCYPETEGVKEFGRTVAEARKHLRSKPETYNTAAVLH